MIGIARWVLSIQEFDIEIQHISGARNNIADYLSRQTYEFQELQVSTRETSIINDLATKFTPQLRKMFKDMLKYQKLDERIQKIIRKLQNKEKISKKYEIHSRILYVRQDTRLKVYLPQEVLIKLLVEVHEAYGHVVPRKVYYMLFEDFYAFKMRYNIKKKLKFCDMCQRTKCPNQPVNIPQKYIELDGPDDLLSIDFLGELPQSRSKIYTRRN